MSQSEYKLINPYIEGSMDNKFFGKTHAEAAEQTWTTISKYITNNVPQFAFTLENNDNGQLHHFLVKESLIGGSDASFNISELQLNLKSKDAQEFKNRAKDTMKGGKKKHKRRHDDDSSSSSSSSSDSASSIFSALKSYKKNKGYPITYWWYDPLVYKLDSVYIPTFVAPIVPYIEVMTLNYYP